MTIAAEIDDEPSTTPALMISRYETGETGNRTIIDRRPISIAEIAGALNRH